MTQAVHIEGFEILEKVGDGPTGTVWKARQVALDRVVAVKVLHDHIRRDPAILDRVRKETETTAKLSHPNFIDVYDIVEKDEQAYIVMEYVEGYCINDWLRRGKIVPEKNALLIAENVGFALEYMWTKARIIHCDLKPGNVILGLDGTVKVSGPGLGKVAGVSAEKIVGINPHYMSPEQACGEENLDQRADIYSLGALLYHMVTARLPFDEPTVMEVVAKLRTDQLDAPKDLNPKLSSGICWLIEKLMVKERARRHPDWNAVLEDIAQVQGGYLPLGKLPIPGESAVKRSAKVRPPLSETQKLTKRVGARDKISSIRIDAKRVRRHLAQPKRRSSGGAGVLMAFVKILILIAIGVALGICFMGGRGKSFAQKVRSTLNGRDRSEPTRPGGAATDPTDGSGGKATLSIGAGVAGGAGGSAEEAPIPEIAVPERIPFSGTSFQADELRPVQGPSRQGRVLGYRQGVFSVLSCAEEGGAVIMLLKANSVGSIVFAPETKAVWRETSRPKLLTGTLLRLDRTRLEFESPTTGRGSVELARVKELATRGRGEKVETVRLGDPPDLGPYLVWGQVTMFLFSASTDSQASALDVDRAVRLLTEHLSKLSTDNTDLYLRIVDLGTPNSALAKRLQVPFVPCVLVFDKIGRRIGNANASPLMLQEYIKEARKTGLASSVG